MTGAQKVWLAEVESLLVSAGTSAVELGFPFLAWFDRNVKPAWIVNKALLIEEAA